MTQQATKKQTEDLVEEERTMDGEIERLEDEQRELDSPARVLTWGEIQAGAVEDLEKREQRRGILPRLLAAAKIRRLEIRRERLERESEPLDKLREDAYEMLQKATAKRLAAIEKENAARYKFADALAQTQRQEKRAEAIDRELRELRGEG